MPALTPYEEAQKYINNNGERYLNLLETVRGTCKRIESLDRQHVKSVYSRGEKQKKNSELKETWKLPKKLLKMRQEQEGSEAGKRKRKGSAAHKTWYDIPDVIGVTVVVYYPDHIKTVLQRIVEELRPHKISLEEQKIKTEFGYHADHAVFVSKGSSLHRGLRCEVQCKTMLHDAWATKMHDLTYKPIGYLEPRLELLMQAFGDTLERVERQSQAIRDMIMEKWNAESERRRLTHGMLFLRLEKAKFNKSSTSKETKQIRALIEEHRDDIKLAANADDKIIASICERIDDLCKKNLHEGWVLAALLASFRPKPDLVSYLTQHAEAFLEHASHVDYSKGDDSRVLTVPLAYVAAGNMDLAVNAYVKLLAAHEVYGLSKEQIRQCKFNHANALVERHYYDLDESRDGTADELRKRVEELLGQASSASRRYGSATRRDRELEDASTRDTSGFMKIVFASKPEHVHEVSAGIDLCNAARLIARKHKFDLGEQYCDLHLRLGWRKLMELEANRPETSTGAAKARSDLRRKNGESHGRTRSKRAGGRLPPNHAGSNRFVLRCS